MLRRIGLTNFKCFESLDLPCAPLNLLCGLNGMGKSSVIQAVLVLRQSFETGDLQEGRLVLGGALTDLGAGSDVLFEDAGDEVVGFTLHGDQAHPAWTRHFGYSRGSDQLVAIRTPSDGTGSRVAARASASLSGSRHEGPCPVTGQPTRANRIFAGSGSDAKAKSAMNALLQEDPRADERLVGFADPQRVREAAAKAKAAGLSHIDRPSDWLRADSESATPDVGIAPVWRGIAPFGGRLVYVQADRTGPRKSYPLSEVLARRGDFGRRGEYAWNYLSEHENDSLQADDPRCGNGSARRLRGAVDHWLQDVSPGAHLQLESVLAADAVLAGFTFDRPGDVSSRRHRATNVGFGLSYVLPVVLALLSEPGTLCLIENPEAHLHPRGQTKLAELAVRAAVAGVQVFAETHSDHFLDGVRLAIHDGLIPPADVAIHYFERNGGRAVVSSPTVDADGRLSRWPTGFFDQHEENLSRDYSRHGIDVREMILNHASLAPAGWRDALGFLPDLADGMAGLVRAGAAQSTLRMSRPLHETYWPDDRSLFDAFREVMREGARDQSCFS